MRFDIIAGEAPNVSVAGIVGSEVRLLVEVAKNMVEADTLHINNKRLTSAIDLFKCYIGCQVIVDHHTDNNSLIAKDHGIGYTKVLQLGYTLEQGKSFGPVIGKRT